jgi:acetyl esterase/lipase
MMQSKRVFSVVFVSLLCLVPALAADISGKWTARIETMIGEMNYTFEFKVDGEKLTGRAVSSTGSESDLTEGSVKGDEISFVEMLTAQGQTVRCDYKGKISGDQIKFSRKVGDFATEEFVAKRSESAGAQPAAQAPPQAAPTVKSPAPTPPETAAAAQTSTQTPAGLAALMQQMMGKGGEGALSQKAAGKYALMAQWDKMPDIEGSGPFPASYEMAPGALEYVVYRPKDLAAASRARKLGVYIWGNGGCTSNGATARFHLTEIASRGFVAIAPGIISSGPKASAHPKQASAASGGGQGTATVPSLSFGGGATAEKMISALDWILAENNRQGSSYYQLIDTSRIAIGGNSCGGLIAIKAAMDPRAKALVVQNSGVFSSGGSGIMSSVTNLVKKEDLAKLHTPILYITGGPDDMAQPNALMNKAEYIMERPKAYEEKSFTKLYELCFGLFLKIEAGGSLADKKDADMIEYAMKTMKEVVQIADPEKYSWYIWGDKMPMEDNAGKYEFFGCLDNEKWRPFLVPYMLKDQSKVKANIIVVAGGGYFLRSNIEEAYSTANVMNGLGYNCFVLQRRVSPYPAIDSSLDVQRAVRYLNYHAKEYGIAKIENLVTSGFSGGGGTITNAAKTLYGDVLPSTVYPSYINDDIDKLNSDVDAMLVIYASGDAKNSNNPNYPATFIAYGTLDSLVEGASDYYKQLKAKGVFAEIHGFAGAPHGFGAGTGIPDYTGVNPLGFGNSIAAAKPDYQGSNKPYLLAYTGAQQWTKLADIFLDQVFKYKPVSY